MRGDAGRCGEMQGDAGRCREMWGDAGRCRERTSSTSVPSRSSRTLVAATRAVATPATWPTPSVSGTASSLPTRRRRPALRPRDTPTATSLVLGVNPLWQISHNYGFLGRSLQWRLGTSRICTAVACPDTGLCRAKPGAGTAVTGIAPDTRGSLCAPSQIFRFVV